MEKTHVWLFLALISIPPSFLEVLFAPSKPVGEYVWISKALLVKWLDKLLTKVISTYSANGLHLTFMIIFKSLIIFCAAESEL
jgi:hypothetical protein